MGVLDLLPTESKIDTNFALVCALPGLNPVWTPDRGEERDCDWDGGREFSEMVNEDAFAWCRAAVMEP